MHIVVINLDRSADRLANFRARNHFLTDITRFSAIDGINVSRSELHDAGILDAQVNYTNGALGCAMSHFALWEEAIRQGATMTICEDDAVFNAGFAQQAAKMLGALPEEWDIIL